MAWWNRKKELEPRRVVTVLDPSVADRLDEATQRLESIVQQLAARLDEFGEPVSQAVKKRPVKKAAKKKAPAKRAAPRPKKESQ